MSAWGDKDHHLQPSDIVCRSLLGELHVSLETHLIRSLAYHPQMDGQTKQVNQILENMLRACVMEYQGSWDKNLPWVEFSYNNCYQESLKMAPFEVLDR
jgi:hypothetical protein